MLSRVICKKMSKLLTYCVLRSTQPPTPAGREMSSSLRARGLRPVVADWNGGMTASCTAGSIVRAMDSHNAQ